MTIGRALAEVVSKAGVPYGYTLAVWSTGALCIGRFGLPSSGEVFLFVAGGTAGYAGLALFVTRGGVVRAARPPAALWENVFAVPAIVATYGLDRLVSSPGANYFLSPLVATVVYILGLSVLVSWVTSREERGRPTPEGDAGRSARDAGHDEEPHRIAIRKASREGAGSGDVDGRMPGTL